MTEQAKDLQVLVMLADATEAGVAAAHDRAVHWNGAEALKQHFGIGWHVGALTTSGEGVLIGFRPDPGAVLGYRFVLDLADYIRGTHPNPGDYRLPESTEVHRSAGSGWA
jgi:hypothetical protein